ncbi:MAG: ABC-2 family transporter protein, partial [Verrucomicrobiae bacterium]|nr:ABC-2 family transporter protein [Verrucomicrobiae bacterium]
MYKYFHVLNIGFQNTFVYRWNFLLRCLFSFVPLMGMIFLWRAVYAGGGVQGYTFGGMISYFVALVILDSLASPTEDDWQIAAEIRDGLINQFLLKPVNYYFYRFCLFWSSRLIYTLVVAIPVAVLIFILRKYLVFPDSLLHWGQSALAVVLSACLQFGIAYCTAMMAFWLLDI